MILLPNSWSVMTVNCAAMYKDPCFQCIKVLFTKVQVEKLLIKDMDHLNPRVNPDMSI